MIKQALKQIGTIFSLAGLMSVAIFTATPAMAGKHCKDVYISAINKTGAKIKIIDLDYYDPAYSKWRSEPTPNEVIASGKIWQETRRLEKVNAKKTKIRVQYRKAKTKGAGKWSFKVYNAYSRAKTCGKGSSYEVTIR